MAIAFDASTQGTAGVTSPQTYSHTCTGSDLILYVHIYTVGTGNQVTGVTYNGVSMTSVGSIDLSTFGRTYLYRLVNPASGANNVVITYSGSQVYGVSVATSYTGALQSGGTFVSNTAVDATPDVSVVLTPNSSGNWIAMAMGNDGAAPFGGGGSASVRQIGSNVAIIAYDTNGGVSGSTTMTATMVGGNNLSVVAESFEPSAAASAIKTIDGLAKASVKTVDGLAIASVKTWNGLA